VTVRRYHQAADYARVGRFLVRTYRATGRHVNWLQPRWEYMHFHPLIRGVDLNVVVVAPDGNFVSYCGMWFEPVHSIAYVEPVATDPDYRRTGLGRAAVLEGIRRCGEMGARVAWVGSTMPFYRSLGFRMAYRNRVWQREWS